MQVQKLQQRVIGWSCHGFRVAERKEQFYNLHNAFAVMKIKNDQKLKENHSPELLESWDKGLSSKLEHVEDEDVFDEDFVSSDEAESSVGVVAASSRVSGMTVQQ